MAEVSAEAKGPEETRKMDSADSGTLFLLYKRRWREY